MAFDANGLNVVVSSISGGTFRVASYETDDGLATVLGSGYFTNAKRHGLKLDSFIEVFGGDNNYTVRIASIDSDGHATGVLLDNDEPNLLDWDGVDPTGNNDNRSYLVSAIAQAKASKRMVVIIPGGYYQIDTDGGLINLPEGMSLRGVWTGHQVRSPLVSTQGTLIGITGATNSAFGANRACRISGLSFYWPEQRSEADLASLDPIEYPHLIVQGTDTSTSGFGRAIFEDIRLINCDKFIKSGLATGSAETDVPGGNLFLRNVMGSVYRTFVEQHNAASLSEFNNLALSTVFNPDASDNTIAWQHENLTAFRLVGEIIGLKIIGFDGNRFWRFIHHTNTHQEDKGMNFARIIGAMLDGCYQVYVTDNNTGPRNLQWDSCEFSARNVNDAVTSQTAFDYTSSLAQTGGPRNVTYSNCIFRTCSGKWIKVGGTETVGRLVVTGSVIEEWAQGSASSANTPAIEIDNSSTDVVLSGNQFVRSDTSHVGVELAAANQVTIDSSFDSMATAVSVSGTVAQLDLPRAVTNCTALTVSGTITDLVPSGGKNYISNPSFDAWQAGTSFAIASNTNTFLADRWKCRRTGTGITVSRQTGFAGATFCLRVQRAEADSSTGVFRGWHQLESAVVRQLAGKKVTLSFNVQVGANLSATTLGIGFHTGTAGGESVDMSSSAASAFATGGAVTQEAFTMSAKRFYTTTITVPSNAADMALRFSWTPSGTAGAADYWEITNVKLEVGGPTKFEPIRLDMNLAECQRFYQKSFLQATTPAQNVGSGTGEFRAAATSAGATANTLGTVRLPVTMRAAPTVTLFNPAAANAQVRDLTSGADCTNSAAGNITESTFEITCTANAGTAVGEVLGVHWTADARL